MRKIFLTLATLACAATLAALLSACKADDPGNKAASTGASRAPQQPIDPADGARRVTVAELQKLMERGEAVVVDVRSKDQYEQGHIKGAIMMPTNEIPNRMNELPKDKQIVFYCA